MNFDKIFKVIVLAFLIIVTYFYFSTTRYDERIIDKEITGRVFITAIYTHDKWTNKVNIKTLIIRDTDKITARIISLSDINSLSPQLETISINKSRN